MTSHPLALPPSFSPDDLDPLTELSVILAKVRTGIQASNGINTNAGNNPSGQQLSFKEVPGATDSLKHKLQRAKAQVVALPDMKRTIDQQEEEMRELQGKIAMQVALLDRLKEDSSKSGKDDEGGDKMDTS